MKIISNKQFKKLDFTWRRSELNKILFNFKVGQHLFISKKEWKLKSQPGNIIHHSANIKQRGTLRGQKFTIRELSDNSGWIITKLK